MALKITRLDGSIVEIHDGTMRLKAQIQLHGTAEVFDSKTGQSFLVGQLANGSVAEIIANSVQDLQVERIDRLFRVCRKVNSGIIPAKSPEPYYLRFAKNRH